MRIDEVSGDKSLERMLVAAGCRITWRNGRVLATDDARANVPQNLLSNPVPPHGLMTPLESGVESWHQIWATPNGGSVVVFLRGTYGYSGVDERVQVYWRGRAMLGKTDLVAIGSRLAAVVSAADRRVAYARDFAKTMGGLLEDNGVDADDISVVERDAGGYGPDTWVAAPGGEDGTVVRIRLYADHRCRVKITAYSGRTSIYNVFMTGAENKPDEVARAVKKAVWAAAHVEAAVQIYRNSADDSQYRRMFAYMAVNKPIAKIRADSRNRRALSALKKSQAQSQSDGGTGPEAE